MIPSRLVLATANRGKVEELASLVREWGSIEVLSLADLPGFVLPPEDGETYAANAVAKAVAAARASGLPALADDSGLEVDALGGAPGVRSARWAGAAATDADRVGVLLQALRDAPPGARGARFRCVVALAWPEGPVETAEGECSGRIAARPDGVSGFGYDPIFVPDELRTTFAAAPPAAKARLSHRARAMRALGARLRHA